MKITERRLVFQDWYECEDSKTGWDSWDWRFLDSTENIYSWNVVEILESDKYGNPILGIAEKQTEIQ